MMKINRIIAFLPAFLLCHALFAQANYDESKVRPYRLPEILVTPEGKAVTTVGEWETTRRPEILKLFEENVYGQVPKDFDGIDFHIKNENENAMEGRATLKEVAITVSRGGNSLTMNLVMFTPNQVRKPVPTFLVINHRGMRTMDVTREHKTEFWPAEEVVDAGYGIAGFDVKDVAPDDKEKFAEGVIALLYPEQREMDDGMRALSAWAWGASRAIDYFEKDEDVDAEKIIVVGHSRGGKTALWCGAQDKRVAISISNDSGCTGAALLRRNFGEEVGSIVNKFPHWFCLNYAEYSNNVDKLPVDQHMLIALIAPRAVYVAIAAEDLWADPKGQYLSLTEAHEVFELYGFKDNFPSEMPPVNEQLIYFPRGFHNREGKHNMKLYDWQQFIKFANDYFNRRE